MFYRQVILNQKSVWSLISNRNAPYIFERSSASSGSGLICHRVAAAMQFVGGISAINGGEDYDTAIRHH